MARKRIALSLDDYSLTMISRISEDLGKSKSDVVVELLHLMGPALSHISAAKRMVDVGLKETGEEAFRGFLRGMQQEFEGSVEAAEAAFFTVTNAPASATEGEHMQPDTSAASRGSRP